MISGGGRFNKNSIDELDLPHPPHSLEAERQVLGAAMLSEEVLGEILEEIDQDAFYLDAHKKIFTAIKSLFNKGKPVDSISVAQELQLMGPNFLEQIGGVAYLADLCAEIITPSRAKYYAEIVKKDALLRDLIKAGHQIASLGYFPNSDNVGEVIDHAEAILYRVSQSRVKDRFIHIGEVIRETYDYLDRLKDLGHELTGIPTGFKALDETLLGLQPSDLIILAARPSIGKTSFALCIARNVAVKYNYPVAIFSLEMSKIQLAQRLLSIEAEIKSHAFRTGNIATEEIPRLMNAIERLSNAKIFIDDSPSLTVTELRTKARRLKNKEDIKLIIIDYLQLIQGDGQLKDRYQQVSEISRSLKILAKELDIPVLALSQLSREIEKRSDPRPKLSDLRESGSIEQDADVVIFLYTDKDKENKKDSDLLEPDLDIKERIVEIAKHRHGPTRQFKINFVSDFTRFEDLEVIETSYEDYPD
jgi:replicative DNA helicase